LVLIVTQDGQSQRGHVMANKAAAIFCQGNTSAIHLRPGVEYLPQLAPKSDQLQTQSWQHIKGLGFHQ
jgi:hypothetical protein